MAGLSDRGSLHITAGKIGIYIVCNDPGAEVSGITDGAGLACCVQSLRQGELDTVQGEILAGLTGLGRNQDVFYAPGK